MPGFPKKDKFKSKKEVDYYFNGDKIQCLICGKWYKQINNDHLNLHDTTIEEYRERFGLPWTRGLCSCKTHDKRKDHATERVVSGDLDIWSLADKYRHLCHKNGHRKRPEYQIKMYIERLKKTRKKKEV